MVMQSVYMASQQQRSLATSFTLNCHYSYNWSEIPVVSSNWTPYTSIMERVYFLRIQAGMQFILLSSLKPDVISISSALEKYYTLEFKSMWEKLLHHIH